MGKHHRWSSYYIAFIKECGKECWGTWRSEMLASAVTILCIYLINRSAIDLVTALLATAYTLCAFVLWHLARTPWTLYQKLDEADRLKNIWIISGISFVAGTFVLLLYTAAWFYTMQPAVAISRTPDSRDIRIAQLEAQLNANDIDERPDSLRRRTVKLADEIRDFWIRNPAPPYPNVQNPTTDEDIKKQKTFNDYWRRVETVYNRKYKDRVIGIVREYKNKGIPTGFLEAGAENHVFGASAFTVQGSPVCFQDEVCQFRELAFHVDARDQMIGPNF